MSPFDVGALDTDGALSATLVQACLSYRRLSSKLTQMANEALARFLVRSDCAALRDEVVGRANDAVEAAAGQARRVTSETAAYLQLLCFVVRFASAAGLRVRVVRDPGCVQRLLAHPNRELRKMVAVLCSRVSQSFLRRQYTWMDNARMDYVDELQDFDVPREFDLYADACCCCPATRTPSCGRRRPSGCPTPCASCPSSSRTRSSRPCWTCATRRRRPRPGTAR